MPKWKFNKKNSKTYRAVYGDESERAIWYDDHGNRVYGKDFGEDDISVQSSSIRSTSDPKLTKEKRLKKQRKYGIFFDDDYNYLQHLKSSKHDDDIEENSDSGDNDSDNDDEYNSEKSENTDIQISKKKTEGDIDFEYVDYDLDSDYENAMDDDFDYENPENILEDDFVILANQDQNCSDVQRSEHLRFIDEEFENFCKENYLSDDFEDYEEIDYSDTEIEKLKELTNEIVDKNKSIPISKCEFGDEIKAKILEYADGLSTNAETSPEKYEENSCNSDFEYDSDDCKSMVSINTTVSRGPQLLDDLQNQSKNVKLPLSSTSSSSSLLSSSDPDPNKIVLSKIKELSIRPKNETKKDKHARQKELKELRHERRMLKKESKLHFRDEKLTVLSKQLTDRKKGVKKLQ